MNQAKAFPIKGRQHNIKTNHKNMGITTSVAVTATAPNIIITAAIPKKQ